MSKPEVLIKAVTVQKLSYGQVARRYGVSKSLVHRLHHRWLADGDAAFQPRSSAPRTNPNRTPEPVQARVLQLRDQLTKDGLDAGPDTIHTHLLGQGHRIGRTTVWRILTRAGKVTPQRQKRPKSSRLRFAADRPNQIWQSDFTHWTLTTGAAEYGYPASTLTDNGMVDTGWFGWNALDCGMGLGFTVLGGATFGGAAALRFMKKDLSDFAVEFYSGAAQLQVHDSGITILGG